jgi:uncharacterized membrane protein YeaQ/YmgE (transglycosylase-associated protein family)
VSILWTIVIGFVAGVIAKLITPGKNEPSGFILTTILGIVGAFVATYLGQAIGWYRLAGTFATAGTTSVDVDCRACLIGHRPVAPRMAR